MRIDRQRALIDAVTAAVPVLVLSALAGCALVARPEESFTVAEVLEISLGYLVLAVGPQLAQAVIGQLLFRRVHLPAWVRGMVMVAVWSVTLVTIVWVAVGPTAWVVIIGVYVVPLQIVTRLGVRAVVRRRSRRTVSGRQPRRPPATAPPAAR